jgi:hypothetical protein
MHVASVYFQVFHLFHSYVASVLYGCCIYLQGHFKCFASVSGGCFMCFSRFGRMLQMFYLDVAKVDMVLHMLQWNPLTATAPLCVTVMHLGGCTIGMRVDSCVPETKQAWAGLAYAREAECARCKKEAARETERR